MNAASRIRGRRNRCTEDKTQNSVFRSDGARTREISFSRNRALLPNMLMQDKDANCEKWQEKPLPVSDDGRQGRLDLYNPLDNRVIGPSPNADLYLPSSIVGNLNQSGVKQAVRTWAICSGIFCRSVAG
jgi:hypothetical protein